MTRLALLILAMIGLCICSASAQPALPDEPFSSFGLSEEDLRARHSELTEVSVLSGIAGEGVKVYVAKSTDFEGFEEIAYGLRDGQVVFIQYGGLGAEAKLPGGDLLAVIVSAAMERWGPEPSVRVTRHAGPVEERVLLSWLDDQGRRATLVAPSPKALEADGDLEEPMSGGNRVNLVADELPERAGEVLLTIDGRLSVVEGGEQRRNRLRKWVARRLQGMKAPEKSDGDTRSAGEGGGER